MKKIGNYVEMINEELEGAKCYAEKYIEMKADGNSQWAEQFRDMSKEEINHANHLHELAIYEINKLNQVFKPRQDMKEKWNASHKHYTDYTEWINEMLDM